MGARLRAFDWSSNPLGPPERWPQSLKTAVRITLTSRQPFWLGWGEELIYLYNDPYRAIIGGKHPRMLGEPTSVVWREIWDVIAPMLSTAMKGDEGTYVESQLLIMERHGYREETYYTFSYSPIPNDDGTTGGILCANTDDTGRVIGERQLALLRELAAETANARSWQEACSKSERALTSNPRDLPFAMIYLYEPDGRRLVLAGAAGIDAGHPAAPAEIDLTGPTPLPFETALESREVIVVEELGARWETELPTGAWNEPPSRAALVPIAPTGRTGRGGVMVVGLSPFRLFEDDYRNFLSLIGGQISGAIASAQAFEEEKRRAEALAELDRAKTLFFTNVSHEFRTPLTLMLGPVEDILAKPVDDVLPENRTLLELVHRQGLHLLKLVNTLLDFSRLEGGRMEASYTRTDVAAFTAELASMFRSAVEKAGLRLLVDCPPIDVPVHVDRDLWEKVVLNLLSNAFKFTLEGEIEVRLRRRGETIELTVRDTGVGIPPKDLPHVFERFHRVEGTRRRSHEGTGIGLALVQELVKLHAGTIGVESREGAGTTFTVSIPARSSFRPLERRDGEDAATISIAPRLYVEEAASWLPEADRTTPVGVLDDAGSLTLTPRANGEEGRPRIVLADDNADMREYVERLLARRFEVEAVGDGQAALAAIRRQPPDLVLTDVMMPELDGFGVLERIRADPELREIPVIMLSARAGEEARIEGVQAGADDYLIKPFSARELVARVSTHVEMARVRREASAAVRESEELLRMAQEAAGAGVWDFDPETGEVRWSEECHRVYGTDPESFEPTYEGWLALLDAEDREPADRAMRTAIAEGTSFTLEFRIEHPLRGLRWVQNLGQTFVDRRSRRTAGIALDVTSRRQAMDEIRRSQEDLSSLFSQSPLPICVMSGRDLVFEMANPAYHQVADRNDLVGRPLLDAMPEIAGQGYEEMLWNVMETGEPVVGQDARLMLERDGELQETFWTFIYAPLREPDGTIRRVVALCNEVTEQRRMMDALRETDRRKDEFLATLAHELRNPLAPIRNSLQILRMTEGNDSGREIAEQARGTIERQLTQLVRLVDDLLDLSRITRGKTELRKERISLRRIVESAVETSRPLIDAAGHELTVTIGAEDVMLDADHTRLAQVVANLLNNAASYTPPVGHIEVEARREGGHALIRVRDDGIGIAADMLPRVFEMFTQAEESRERRQGGLGVGLTLVQRLVEMHGGTVEARSEGPGRGSEFLVRLPIAVAAAGETSSMPGAGAFAAGAAARRILVVDDNRDGAESLSLLLEMMGHEVRTAHDGPAALDEAAAFVPDVVLLDIGMPGMSGYTVARRLRERPELRETLLVALTGWGQEEDRRRSREAGFDHHLTKPADLDALARLLGASRTARPATERGAS